MSEAKKAEVKVEAPKVEGLTLENLKDLLVTVVAEARKPVLSEREQRDIEQVQKERLANAADVKQQMENDRAFQDVCEHKQDLNRDQGKTAMVFVNQDFPKMPGGGRYLTCQICRVKLVPGPKPAQPDPNFSEFRYDTALFNKHFQMLRFD